MSLVGLAALFLLRRAVAPDVHQVEESPRWIAALRGRARRDGERGDVFGDTPAGPEELDADEAPATS